MNTTKELNDLQFRFHPRVFAALGSDLVTNDIVAVVELVKNSYDALASKVKITIDKTDPKSHFIRIEDDGIGMSLQVISDVWFVVGTPYKAENKQTKLGSRSRRVTGEKGLGRLSTARLGDKLVMTTRSKKDNCYLLEVDWREFANATKDLPTIHVTGVDSPLSAATGTRLDITSLKSNWDDDAISELQVNLSRFLSPFQEIVDFKIYLNTKSVEGEVELKINPEEFLSNPRYLIKGGFSSDLLSIEYRFNSIDGSKKRNAKSKLTWEQICASTQGSVRNRLNSKKSTCGPFKFEIRAWDLDGNSTEELATHFELPKKEIRRAISAHKGLSVYRDGVLVLPKSDAARDWLGLDLRRVSKTGSRLSTSQIVGNVEVTADANPGIIDTSDRERFIARPEYSEFEKILKAAISIMEGERTLDRSDRKKQETTTKMLGNISASELVDEITSLADEGGTIEEAVPIVKNFSTNLDNAVKKIADRWVHYNRMATVGTLCEMLVHEIRTRTLIFGDFLDFANRTYGPFQEQKVLNKFELSKQAVESLDRLANTFAPLANRSGPRRKKLCVLEERIKNCLMILEDEIEGKAVKVSKLRSTTSVAVDAAEIEAVVLNILNNSLFWLSQNSKNNREIQIKLSTIQDGKRTRVFLHDNGPGVPADFLEQILTPGFSRKPHGIGMGLTVASEIIASVGGELKVASPGTLGGLSVSFDVPNIV